MSGAPRRRLLVLAATGLAALAVVGLPRGAAAHALRQASSPAADTVVPAPPARVTVTFGEVPDPAASTVAVLDSSGRDHTTGPATPVPGDPRTLAVAVDQLADGVYTVSWRTLSSADGHRAAGSFAFGVGGVDIAQVAASSGPGGGGSVVDSSPPPSAAAVAGRSLLYLGLIAVVGAASLTPVVAGAAAPLPRGGPGAALATVTAPASRRRTGGSPPGRLAALVAAGAGLVALGTALVVGVEAADVGGGLRGLLATGLGTGVVLRLAGTTVLLLLGGAALALHGAGRRRAVAAAGVAAAAGLLVDVANGHAATAPAPLGNEVAQWLHVVAAGVWVGGLAALIVVVSALPAGERMAAARRFSHVALVALLVVLGTGVVRAGVEIDGWSATWTTAFGRVVVAKVVLVIALAALGAVNRWQSLADPPRLLSRLRRIGGTELAVATAAVVAAALLVNETPPVSAGASPGAPAPASVIARGSDAGTSVRVTLTVSPGTPGFDAFDARVTDYDSGAPVAATQVQLDFRLPVRPDVGGSTLALSAGPDGHWTGTGGNLAIDGVWSVTALVARGAGSVDVPLTIATRTTQRVDVSAVAGQPTLYTVHLEGGLQAQWYLDPQTAGADEVHCTLFDAAGRGYPASAGALTATPEGGVPAALPTRQLEPGHYVGDAGLRVGRYRFDVVATGTDGRLFGAHVDVVVGA